MRNAAPFSGLIAGAFSLLRARLIPVTISVLSFALFVAACTAFIQRKIDHIETSFQQSLSLNEDDLSTLLEVQINHLSTLSFQEFIQSVQQVRGIKNPSIDAQKDTIGILYMLKVTPYIVAILVIDLIALFVSFCFFIILFTRGNLSAYETSVLLPKYVLTGSFLLFWMFLRSFIWIPLFGPVLFLYFFPRLAIAPIVHGSGEKMPYASIKASLERTSGQWVFMATRLFLIGLLLLLMLWPAMTIVGVIGLFSMKLSYLFWLFSAFLLVAFGSAALTMLTVMVPVK